MAAKGIIGHGFGVLDEAQFGALVEVNDLQWSRIFIFRGSHSILHATVNRILADSRILPEIGDRLRETVSERTLKDFYNNFESMLAAEGVVVEDGEVPVLPDILPKCPIRAAYADYIIDLVLDFLVGHEMVHYMNGHSGYLQAVNEGKIRKPSDPERRALEFDADSIAMLAVAPANEMRFAQFPPEHPLKNRSPPERLYDLAFARAIMVLVEQEAVRTQQRFAHHPPVMVSMEYSLKLLVEVAEGIRFEERLDAVRNGIGGAIIGYAATTGKRIDPTIDEQVFLKDVAELRQAWASIRPLLERFSCRPLAPVHESVGAVAREPCS